MALDDLLRPRDNEALKDLVLQRVRQNGPISFAEYMQLALYHPQLGYYHSCDPSLDFQTSPQVHPLFGAAVGQTLAEMWRLMGRPARFDVYEPGAGDCRLAADIIRSIAKSDLDFDRALEYSVSDPRLAGADALALLQRADVPDRVRIRERPPEDGEIEGCILSNELLDALPFYRVFVDRGRFDEICVTALEGRLEECRRPAGTALADYVKCLEAGPQEGCAAEVNLNAADWMRQAARGLGRGYILSFDYGYRSQDLYAPWRKGGTLLTFYRMTSGEDPYVRVGRQDITASVDLSTLMRAGKEEGARTLALVDQAGYLSQSPVIELLQRPDTRSLEGYFSFRQAFQVLTDPVGLGRIKVLLQGKGAEAGLPAGFK